MPLYEYKCQKCGAQFEMLVKHDAVAPSCDISLKTEHEGLLERCDGETKKIISKSAFHLKGECWGRDGYSYHNGIDKD